MIVLVLYKVPVEKLVTVDALPLAPTDGEELSVEPELPDPDAGEEAIGDETAEETTLPLGPELPEAGMEAAGDEANGDDTADETTLPLEPVDPETGIEAAGDEANGEEATTELGLDPETPESVTADETGADPDPWAGDEAEALEPTDGELPVTEAIDPLAGALGVIATPSAEDATSMVEVLVTATGVRVTFGVIEDGATWTGELVVVNAGRGVDPAALAAAADDSASATGQTVVYWTTVWVTTVVPVMLAGQWRTLAEQLVMVLTCVA
jgi:hypothetical protein